MDFRWEKWFMCQFRTTGTKDSHNLLLSGYRKSDKELKGRIYIKDCRRGSQNKNLLSERNKRSSVYLVTFQGSQAVKLLMLCYRWYDIVSENSEHLTLRAESVNYVNCHI